MAWLYKTKESWLSFIVYIKANDIYKQIVEGVETRFGTSSYELYRPFPKGKNKKSNWINERWIRLKNTIRICCVKSKTYSNEDEKVKHTKKYVIKRKFNYGKYKSYLEATQLENKINHLEKYGTDVDSLKEDHKEFIKKQ